MARRVSWTNNSSGHTGTYVYRAESLDPQNLPAPVATVAPVAQGATAEWIDSADVYECYAVQDFDGQGAGILSGEVCAEQPVAPFDPSATPGDYTGGGVYVGTMDINGTSYHLISGDAASETSGLAYKASNTNTSGAGDRVDGAANTQAMIVAGITDHPAAEHCVNYQGGGHNDWYLPSRDEQLEIQINLVDNGPHPEFQGNVDSNLYTRSSTDGTSDSSYNRRYATNSSTLSYFDKTDTNLLTRPMRRVPV